MNCCRRSQFDDAGCWWPEPGDTPKSQDLVYTFKPNLTSSWSGIETLPWLDAMMVVLPDLDGPWVVERSTVMVRILASDTDRVMFCMLF